MKQRILTILMILCLGAYFAGQILTADAGLESAPIPTEILQVDNCDSADCSSGLIVAEDGADRVPTAIKLVYTGTDIRDPISTAGIVFIFFVLLALSVLWISMIRNWNRLEDS